MRALIEANLESLKVDPNKIEIETAEASEVSRKFVKTTAEPFDIIFFDPPYAADYEVVLNYIGEHPARLLAEAGILIIEHDKKKEMGDEVGQLKRYRIVKQGDSSLSFYGIHAT